MKKCKNISKIDILKTIANTYVGSPMIISNNKEKIMILQVMQYMSDISKYKIHDYNIMVKECKEIILYNIINAHMDNTLLSLPVIKSML